LKNTSINFSLPALSAKHQVIIIMKIIFAMLLLAISALALQVCNSRAYPQIFPYQLQGMVWIIIMPVSTK
jgi:hypothetical protein